jgi:signal transduction histidine kinase
VRWDGAGIEPSSPLVFERYWQGRYEATDAVIALPTRRPGLGLTIARQLVEAQGGQLTLQSEPGVGSTFVVWLPSDPEAQLSDVVAPDGIHHLSFDDLLTRV